MTGEPAAVNPFSSDLRESLTRFVITCDMNSPSCIRKRPRPHERDDQLFEAKLRTSKFVQYAADQWPVRQRFYPANSVSKVLLDDALLALGALGEYSAKL